MTEQKPNEPRLWSEEIEIAGTQLVARINELIKEGNVRNVIIRRPTGEKLLEFPLTAGVAVGGAVTFFWPVLAAVGALAALVASVKVEIVRVDESPKGDGEPKP